MQTTARDMLVGVRGANIGGVPREYSLYVNNRSYGILTVPVEPLDQSARDVFIQHRDKLYQGVLSAGSVVSLDYVRMCTTPTPTPTPTFTPGPTQTPTPTPTPTLIQTEKPTTSTGTGTGNGG